MKLPHRRQRNPTANDSATPPTTTTQSHQRQRNPTIDDNATPPTTTTQPR
eukprot:CAMPEP_0172315548 /NCGR_PEP_ID=MMETSP1058-20130122/25511_1 /TAXON_ID=83371 /ORGANISM="Detonula confervacea, Strain CCMP 353" /LENGTH=49 /DNA_ID= /DNA_START= /DNA_END= /DNA_ORIENTATION=